jgi:hypothetical protein
VAIRIAAVFFIPLCWSCRHRKKVAEMEKGS